MTRRSWFSGTLALAILCLPGMGDTAQPAPFSNTQGFAELEKELADQDQPVTKRVAIVMAFGTWATAQVRAPLLATLADPLPDLRAAAATALGWPGNREAVDALRARMDMPTELPVVKAAAVKSLGIIGDPASRAVLVTATQDPDAGVRGAALESLALGPLADPSDKTLYLIRLAEDQALEGIPRADAVRALASVKEERVIDALMRIIEREPSRPLAVPQGQPTEAVIMDLRRAQALDVAAWAAAGLGELGAKQAVPLLLRTAEDPRDFFLRRSSLQSLILLDVAAARAVLVRRVDDPLPENRSLALYGLTVLGDRAVIPLALAKLKDEVADVRGQAVVALSTLGDAQVRPALEGLRRTEDNPVVLSVVDEALVKLPR